MPGLSREDLFGRINFENMFGGLDFDMGGGLFDRIFRRGLAGLPRGENIEVTLSVPLDHIAQGGPETVRFSRPTQCQTCGASGARVGTTPRKCERCEAPASS